MEALRAAIAADCRVFDVPWTPEREQTVAALDDAALAAQDEAILRARVWPSH